MVDVITARPRPGAPSAGGTIRSAASGRPLPGVPRAAKRSAQQVFDNMPNDFQAAKSKGVRLTVRFKLSGSGGGDWYVRVDDGKLSITKGSGPKPDVTLIADADDYVKIAAGDMNGPIAFLRGKLRVDGDTALMRKFESMFEYDEG